MVENIRGMKGEVGDGGFMRVLGEKNRGKDKKEK